MAYKFRVIGQCHLTFRGLRIKAAQELLCEIWVLNVFDVVSKSLFPMQDLGLRQHVDFPQVPSDMATLDEGPLAFLVEAKFISMAMLIS